LKLLSCFRAPLSDPSWLFSKPHEKPPQVLKKNQSFKK